MRKKQLQEKIYSLEKTVSSQSMKISELLTENEKLCDNCVSLNEENNHLQETFNNIRELVCPEEIKEPLFCCSVANGQLRPDLVSYNGVTWYWNI